MKFTVVSNTGEITMFEGSFRVADSGVLIIEPQGANTMLLSPAAWLSLEVTDAPATPDGISTHYA